MDSLRHPQHLRPPRILVISRAAFMPTTWGSYHCRWNSERIGLSKYGIPIIPIAFRPATIPWALGRISFDQVVCLWRIGQRAKRLFFRFQRIPSKISQDHHDQVTMPLSHSPFFLNMRSQQVCSYSVPSWWIFRTKSAFEQTICTFSMMKYLLIHWK